MDDPSWDDTLVALLARTSRAMADSVADRLHGGGDASVSVTDAGMLAVAQSGRTTVSDLARWAGITRQAASQRVGALERAGYVERRPSRVDARAVVVRTTELGRAVSERAFGVMDELEANSATQLGEARLDALKKLLVQLLAHLEPPGDLDED